MSVFNFISRLFPETKRSTVDDDISYTKRILDEVSIPLATSFKDVIVLCKDHSQSYKKAEEAFYSITGMRKGNFSTDLLLVLRNARSNLDICEKFVKSEFEETSFSEAIGLRKAHILRALSAIGSIADLTTRMLNHIMKAEEIKNGSDQEITSGEEKAFVDYIRRLFAFFSQYGQEPKIFENILGKIPEAVVTPKNAKEVASVFHKNADPFHKTEINGFIPHLVFFVRDQISNIQINRYESNKASKKQFELRVLMLKSQLAGTPNAGLEKQIQYYENQVAKLQDKIEAFETKYA